MSWIEPQFGVPAPPAVATAAPPERFLRRSPHDARRLLAIKREQARRQCEALRLYRPMPLQERFHQSRAAERILRGSNRAGKTLCTFMELAWLLTGTHPYLPWRKTGGRAYIVGKDEKQIGEVFYDKLFKSGAFRMIRDSETRLWRSYNPLTDGDRFHESKPVPPLLPGRLIKGGAKGIAWRLKKQNVWTKFTTTAGWECHAFTAGSKPPHGMDVDFVLFDEEIPDADWYPEMAARLVDRYEDRDDYISGRFVWSATPQAGTEELLRLSEQAAAETACEKPRVVECFITLDDNTYIEDYKKEVLKQKYLNNPEEYRVRILGQFAAHGYTMYPEFGRGHYISQADLPDGQIPADWTRYVAIDPGNRVCAALFLAVPPDDAKSPADCPFDVARHVYVYDEIYLTDATDEKMALAMRAKCEGQTIHAFIIDDNGSRRTEFGGYSIRQQLKRAFERHGVKCVARGHGFVTGSNDVQAGCAMVRTFLRDKQADGRPRLLVVKETTPRLQDNMKYYRRKIIGGVVQDRPDDRSPHGHTPDALRYLCNYRGLRYRHRPSAAQPRRNRVLQLFERLERRVTRDRRTHVNLGA